MTWEKHEQHPNTDVETSATDLRGQVNPLHLQGGAALWVVWEHLSPGTQPLSPAVGAQHKLRPILQENQNTVQYGGNGRGRKMVAGLPPPLIPTDLPGPILSTRLCWIIP